MPESELNLAWFLAWLVLQRNRLNFGIIYIGIMVYWHAPIAKGLESGVYYRTWEIYRGLGYPVHSNWWSDGFREGNLDCFLHRKLYHWLWNHVQYFVTHWIILHLLSALRSTAHSSICWPAYFLYRLRTQSLLYFKLDRARILTKELNDIYRVSKGII